MGNLKHFFCLNKIAVLIEDLYQKIFDTKVVWINNGEISRRENKFLPRGLISK